MGASAPVKYHYSYCFFTYSMKRVPMFYQLALRPGLKPGRGRRPVRIANLPGAVTVISRWRSSQQSSEGR